MKSRSEYYHDKAAEGRRMAHAMHFGETRSALLKIASAFDRLAARLRQAEISREAAVNPAMLGLLREYRA